MFPVGFYVTGYEYLYACRQNSQLRLIGFKLITKGQVLTLKYSITGSDDISKKKNTGSALFLVQKIRQLVIYSNTHTFSHVKMQIS